MNTFNTDDCNVFQAHFLEQDAAQKQNRVVYELMFVSIVPPFISPNTKFTLTPIPEYSKKVLVKKSYLILTWFYYMSITKTQSVKASPASIAILPSRNKRYTLTKAPMAHKTNSKEQFQFKFYFYKFSITSHLAAGTALRSVAAGGHFGVNGKKNFPFFETNLMLLKYAKIRFVFSDASYFNYYNFTKTRFLS